MATQLQLRRGTTSQVAAFTGANGEVVVDTEKKTLFVNDGSTAGGLEIARADFSNISASATLTLATLNATTLNTTNLDLTNLEVTNIKAKDGTAAGSIADSTGVVTIASAVLTTADINAGTVDAVIGGTTPAAGTFTTITGSGDLVIDTTTLVVDTTNNRVGVGTATPSVSLEISGQVKNNNGYLIDNGTNAGFLTVDGSFVNFGSSTAGKGLKLFSAASALAVTIDSSQNTTFAGTITSNTLNSVSGNDLTLNAGSVNRDIFFKVNASTIATIKGSTNGFYLGTTASRVTSGVTPNFVIEGTSYNTNSAALFTNANSVAECPLLFFGKSRGTSVGSNTIVQNGDRLVSIRIDGNDGTNLEQAAIIEAYVDAAPAANSIPGRLSFMTTNSGSQYATEKMRIDNAGKTTFTTGGNNTVTIGQFVDSTTFNVVSLNESLSTNLQGLIGGSNSSNDLVLQNGENGNLLFRTNGFNERMRIDNAGAAYFMTTDDMQGDVNVKGTTGVAIGTANDQGYYRRIYTNVSSGASLYFWNGNNQGELNSAGVWVDASDIALKKDVADIDYGLDVVKKLKPRKYKMKSDDSDQIGFVAQEVETEVPEVVSTGENPNGEEQKSLSYGHLTAVLTKAIQEQQTQIEALQAEVAAMKGE